MFDKRQAGRWIASRGAAFKGDSVRKKQRCASERPAVRMDCTTARGKRAIFEKKVDNVHFVWYFSTNRNRRTFVKLTPATERFILHWGEMGTKWGINRTVAQIHALLHVSAKPLDAEEIAETLSVA